MSIRFLETENNLGVSDSYENDLISIRSARLDERELVKEFVCRIHVEVSAYDEESKYHQIEDLPVDFPSLYSEELWVHSKTWLCFRKESNQLLGTIGLKHYSEEKVVEIAFFFIESDARGKGIGRTLLKHTISWVRQVKSNDQYLFNAIDLLTLRKHMEPAISLYQTEGFVLYHEFNSKYYHQVRMRLSW